MLCTYQLHLLDCRVTAALQELARDICSDYGFKLIQTHAKDVFTESRKSEALLVYPSNVTSRECNIMLVLGNFQVTPHMLYDNSLLCSQLCERFRNRSAQCHLQVPQSCQWFSSAMVSVSPSTTTQVP